MQRQARIVALLALALIGAAGLWLSHLRTAVRLGRPGVKVGNLPVFNEAGEVARTNSVAMPTLVDGFRTRVEPITKLELGYLPPDTTYGRRFFESLDGRFHSAASVVLMGTDRTSIHRPEYCLTGQGWNIYRQRPATLKLTRPAAREIPVQRFDMRFQGVVDGRPVQRGGVYVFWFVADGQVTGSHFDRQLWLIRDLLLHQTLQRWAYVSFFSDCEPGQEDATFGRIAQLAAATVPEFQLTDGRAP